MTTYARRLGSPLGELTLHASAHGLTAIDFPACGPAEVDDEAAIPAEPARWLAQAAAELTAYFAGDGERFAVPLDALGTRFQHRVWEALVAIPFAATWSYGQLAAAIGQPSAARAVGAANGKNPIPIIVPCHRVIGADGSATGYGGGLPIKRWLLDHEAAVAGAGGHARRIAAGRNDR